MKYYRLFLCISIVINLHFTLFFGQLNPVKDYPELFDFVQKSKVFTDQKKFTDCTPLFSVDSINKWYKIQKETSGFNLKEFVGTYFDTIFLDTLSVIRHINHNWQYLTREPEQSTLPSSLIPLPYPYIVPGGRFREIYYWDSYFTMLGLQEFDRSDIIENMIKNFAFLIDTYGFIPNGNRTYYLSRSQPPFFSLMIDLLAEYKGDDIYRKFLSQLEKEYEFWMHGSDQLNVKVSENQRVVLLNEDEVLNRYRDDLHIPRPESYMQDIHIFNETGKDSSIFRELRSAAESGWDFSSRWLGSDLSLKSIHTTEIIPVDLNCLLFHLEKTLEKAHQISGDKVKEMEMAEKALKRKSCIMKYLWNQDSTYFYDYNFTLQEQTGIGSLAGIFPLFFEMVDQKKAEAVLRVIEAHYLKDGGLVTSLYTTGEQWDAPNGWAPLQWIGYMACKNYGNEKLAEQIARSWLNLNIKVYFDTGKMLEKYNVVNINIPGGGGEYPLQDGFGWTNGVFLKLWDEEFSQ